MTDESGAILALDVGTVRVGLALASAQSRLPQPLLTLDNDDHLIPKLQDLMSQNSVTTIVVGIPRGLDGQETSQSQYVRTFTKTLQAELGLAIDFQDEALSSQRARTELEARDKPYQKGEVDALAATFILEDYLTDNQRRHG